MLKIVSRQPDWAVRDRVLPTPRVSRVSNSNGAARLLLLRLRPSGEAALEELLHLVRAHVEPVEQLLLVLVERLEQERLVLLDDLLQLLLLVLQRLPQIGQPRPGLHRKAVHQRLLRAARVVRLLQLAARTKTKSNGLTAKSDSFWAWATKQH